MNYKITGFLALACLLLTLLWLGLLIADMASAGPLDTFEQVTAHAARLGWLFYVTYLNAALITLAATAFMSALYVTLKPTAPNWAVIGLVFTPVYCVLNLIAYLSQVTVVPTLVFLRADPLYTATVDVLLRLTLQSWSPSAVAFFNGLAYAILGIPSILFGGLLFRHSGSLRWGGCLLALNGVACITGIFGYLTGSSLLSQGVIIGGVLFLMALLPLSWAFLRNSPVALTSI